MRSKIYRIDFVERLLSIMLLSFFIHKTKYKNKGKKYAHAREAFRKKSDNNVMGFITDWQ